MSTPNLFQIQVGQDADQFWGGTPGPDLLLINTDFNDFITIGPKGIQPYGPNGQVIDPQQSISVPSGQAWSCVTDADDGPMLQVNPGGGNYSPSALAIAGQIATSGLALAIAEEIAAQGISLIGNPESLYEFQGGGPSTATNLVGATVITTQDQLDPYQGALEIDGVISRPMCVNARKVYLNHGQTTVPSSSAEFPHSTRMWLCFQPSFTSLTSAEYQLIKTAVNNWIAAGYTNLVVCWWQEVNNTDPQKGGPTSGAQAIAMYQYYTPLFKSDFPAIPVALVMSGSYVGNALNYVPAPSAYDQLSLDAYGTVWNTRGGTATTGMADALVARANADGRPFGFSEIGASLGNQTPLPNNTVATFLQYIIYIVGTVANSPGDVMWYDNNHTNVHNNIPPGSFLIPLIQNLYDTLMPATVAALTINPGATITLTPLAPVQSSQPAGTFALADDYAYELYFRLVAGAGSTSPFVTVKMRWYNQDTTGAQLFDSQTWTGPMSVSTAAGTFIRGSGPQEGQFLQIQLTNKDTVACTVTDYEIISSSRIRQRHDWLWDSPSSSNVPGFTTSAGQGFSNQLAVIDTQSLGAGATISVLTSMWAGAAYLRAHVGTSGKVNIVLTPIPSSVFKNADLVNDSPGNQEYSNLVYMPRGCCLLQMINNDTVAHTVQAQLIALD